MRKITLNFPLITKRVDILHSSNNATFLINRMMFISETGQWRYSNLFVAIFRVSEIASPEDYKQLSRTCKINISKNDDGGSGAIIWDRNFSP